MTSNTVDTCHRRRCQRSNGSTGSPLSSFSCRFLWTTVTMTFIVSSLIFQWAAVNAFLMPTPSSQQQHRQQQQRKQWPFSSLSPISPSPSSTLSLSSTISSDELEPENFIEAFLMKQKPAGVSKQTLMNMIQRRRKTATSSSENGEDDTDDDLRENFVVVITGATGGIGSGLCKAVLELGGLVIAVDYQQEALDKFVNEQIINDNDNDNDGSKDDYQDRIRTVVSDFGDLDSVSKAADEIINQVGQIDILVNNAGITYSAIDDENEDDVAPKSAQGYDLAFQINYLSHFLLTEKLLPKMNPTTSRVVHIASGLHWTVNGSGLLGSDPPASRGNQQDRVRRHIRQSYGNTKLAQIWHTVQLNRLQKVTAVAACPSWTATGIAGNNEFGSKNLNKFGFSTLPRRKQPNYGGDDDKEEEEDLSDEIAGPGLKSILNAMFLPKNEIPDLVLQGQRMFGNAEVFDNVFPPPEGPEEETPWILSDGVSKFFPREDLVLSFAMYFVMPFQRWYHRELTIQNTSPECANVEGQESLYAWSKEVISGYVSDESATVMGADDEVEQQAVLLV